MKTKEEWGQWAERKFGDSLIDSDEVGCMLFNAVAEEREACAKIAEAKEEECREAGFTTLFSMSGDMRCREVAEAIRARGQ